MPRIVYSLRFETAPPDEGLAAEFIVPWTERATHGTSARSAKPELWTCGLATRSCTGRRRSDTNSRPCRRTASHHLTEEQVALPR
jgi:hypothetical protein